MSLARAAGVAGIVSAVVAAIGFIAGLFMPDSQAGRIVCSIVGGVIIADTVTVDGGECSSND